MSGAGGARAGGAAAAALWLLACAAAPTGSDAGRRDAAATPVADLAACAPKCDASNVCTPGLSCIGPVAGGPLFVASCLAPCTTTSDCPAAAHCVSLTTVDAPGRWCITDEEPAPCGGAVACTPFSTGRCDTSSTWAGPYAQKLGSLCGTEYVTCPVLCRANGC